MVGTMISRLLLNNPAMVVNNVDILYGICGGVIGACILSEKDPNIRIHMTLGIFSALPLLIPQYLPFSSRGNI